MNWVNFKTKGQPQIKTTEMKTRTVTVFLLVLLATAHAQTTKTQNVIIVTLDGYRWQELFTGADPVLVKNEKYVRGLESLLRQFWDDDPIKRRKALMPFFWSVIAREANCTETVRLATTWVAPTACGSPTPGTMKF